MKTFYYTDELEDDFAGTNITPIDVFKDFNWFHESTLWDAFANFLYFFIAYPLVKIINKVVYGLKIKNKKALRRLRKTGYFLYGNHTQLLDPLIAAEVAGWRKRTYFIASADTFSISGIKHLVTLLGAIPVASNFSSMKKMTAAIKTRYEQNSCITIFPEAHIWPYYNGIRDFKSTAFTYPVSLNAPSVAMVVTYTKRKGLFRFLKRPGITVHCSDPVYPNNALSKSEAKQTLRNYIYGFMKSKSCTPENVEYIRYVKQENPKE